MNSAESANPASLEGTRAPTASPSASWRATDVAIVAALAALTLAIRLVGIGDRSLWVDEGASLAFARATWHAIWVLSPTVETNPPLYYAFLKAWISLFGTSEAALRLPSALFGTLAVVPLYALAFRAGGRAAAVIAALLYALSAVQVQYAQEARTFAALTLAYLLAIWAGTAFVTRRGAARRRFGVAFVLTCAAMPWLHHTAFLAVAAAFVFLVVAALPTSRHPGARLRDLVLAGLAVLVLTTPVLYWVWVHMTAPATLVDWIPRPTLASAYSLYRGTFGHTFISFLDIRQEGGVLLGLADPYRIADAALALASGLAALVALQRRNWMIIAALAALAFVVCSYFVFSLIKPILLGRVILYATPLLAIVVAYGISTIRPGLLRTASAFLLVGAAAANTALYFRTEIKEPWSDMIAAARADYDSGMAVLSSSASVGTITLVARYWPDFAGQAGTLLAIDAAPDPLAPIVGYAVPLTHVGWDELCRSLEGADRLMILQRRSGLAGGMPRAETLRSAFEAAGASELEERAFPPHLYLSIWSAPDCALRP